MSILKSTKPFWEYYDIADIVAYNLKTRLDYGFAELGAFTNIASGSRYYDLQRVNDPRHPSGTVFEGFGSEWIWETDISPVSGVGVLPYVASGVYVDNVFYPTGSTGYGDHYIDYFTGKIVFASGVPSNVTVSAEYSTRDIAVYLGDSPQWRRFMEDYEERYDQIGSISPSGVSQILKENRIWLPAIIIDTKDTTNTGLQLGGGEISTCNVVYSVFADLPFANKKICDLLVMQDERTIKLFDVNNIPKIFNNNGSIGSGALTYSQLTADSSPYFWTFARTEDTNGGPVEHTATLNRGVVRQRINVYRYNITY